MDIYISTIPGCYEIIPTIVKDKRGMFIKTFNYDYFSEYGMETSFKEEYYTISKKNVIRGLHFQLPPMEHVKKVCCLDGRVLDLVLDLRKDSPAYLKYHTFDLNSDKSNIIYIPKGCAHGFLTLSKTALMLYSVSTVYSPVHDTGILWNSINFDWNVDSPVISERDESFVKLDEFDSPFLFEDTI